MSDRFSDFMGTASDGALYLVWVIVAIVAAPLFILFWPIGKLGQLILKERQANGRPTNTNMRGP